MRLETIYEHVQTKLRELDIREVSIEEFQNYINCVFGNMIANHNYTLTRQDIDDYVQFVKDSQN